jgi:hypothetical protein
VAGFAFQMMNDLLLYNAEDCTFWVFDVFTDFVNGFLLLIEDNDPIKSVTSFAYSFHKAPVAYYSCDIIREDYNILVNFYNYLQLDANMWAKLVYDIFLNIFFNWVDLLYEFVTLYKVQEEREWTQVGTYGAKIVVDIIFKGPHMDTWNYKNSDVLNDEWGEPINLIDGLVKEINFLLEQWGLEKIPVDPEVEARYKAEEGSRVKPTN